MGREEGAYLRGCAECGLSARMVGGCPWGSKQKGELSGSEALSLAFYWGIHDVE